VKFSHRIEGESRVRTVTLLNEKKAKSSSARAYVLLNLAKGDLQRVAQALRHKLGVLMADPRAGRPDVIMLVEAPGKQGLAGFTINALSSVENMIENVRLLPIHS
jgi:hypothetical protein